MHEPSIEVRPVEAFEEPLVEAFIVSHAEHGPGHRRALAAVERALGHREISQVAMLDGRVVGFAPAFVMQSRVLRLLRVRRVAGGSLVATGPLVDTALSDKAAHHVLDALVRAVHRTSSQAGALEHGWVLPPMAGTRSTITAHRPLPMLALGTTLGHVPGPVVDLSRSEAELMAALSATTRTRVRRSLKEPITVRVLADRGESVQKLASFRAGASTAFAGFAEPELAFDAVCTHLLGAHPVPAVSTTHAQTLRAHRGFTPAPIAHLVLIEREGVPLSAVVTCESNGAAYYLLAFNTDDGRLADSNRLALWHAMLQAKDRGMRWFQLGSLDFGAGKAASISAFKRQFGGSIMLAPVVSWRVRPFANAVLTLLQTSVSAVRGATPR